MVKQGIMLVYVSLLGKDKNNSFELTPIGRNKYIDIFNATNVLYEEMKQKCKIQFKIKLIYYSKNSKSD